MLPPYAIITPAGLVATEENKFALVILANPVAPVTLFNKNSSSACELTVALLPPIIVLLIVALKVFVVPPDCPSKVNAGAVTSPANWKVVAEVNLSAEPALPETVPLTLPTKFPVKLTE